jgi:hypothetical protein
MAGFKVKRVLASARRLPHADALLRLQPPPPFAAITSHESPLCCQPPPPGSCAHVSRSKCPPHLLVVPLIRRGQLRAAASRVRGCHPCHQTRRPRLSLPQAAARRCRERCGGPQSAPASGARGQRCPPNGTCPESKGSAQVHWVLAWGLAAACGVHARGAHQRCCCPAATLPGPIACVQGPVRSPTRAAQCTGRVCRS